MTRHNRSNRFRRLYPILIELGFVGALLVVIGAFRFNYRAGDGLDLTSPPVVPIELVPIVPTDITPKPPPPPRPPVPVVVPDDSELGDDPIEIGDPIDIQRPLPVAPAPPPAVDTGTDDPFVVVEDYPEPIGGRQAIMKRVRYPDIARKAGIEGVVVVEFIVERDGSVSGAHVVKGIGGGCDEAALEAIQDTNFTPGMQRRVPVRVRMKMSIRFAMRN